MPRPISSTKAFALMMIPFAFSAIGCAATTREEAAMTPAPVLHVQHHAHHEARLERGRLHAHYSTNDGSSGFILDRTTPTWKAKLDGSERVHALTMQSGPADTKEYRSDDNSIWLRVNKHDAVVLFQGPNQVSSVPVVHDASALIWR